MEFLRANKDAGPSLDLGADDDAYGRVHDDASSLDGHRDSGAPGSFDMVKKATNVGAL